jgi:UDP-GlcNAc:undecaprenyl-phosphate GlcNAc-1-phosphate transferase
MNNLFVLSEKDLIKLAIMMLLAAIGFGLPGLVMMIILQWMTRQSYAKDSVDKHGISSVSASRLGGAAVAVCTVILLVIGGFTGLSDTDLAPRGLQLIAWFAVLICLGLGLVEDLRNDTLSPVFRLLVEFVVFAVLIALMPSLIPLDLGIWALDALIAVPVIGCLLTVIFCVGFINAINMADGANGLIPGILTISFGLFYAETGAYSYACLMTSCGLFTIFNVISGRLFLGDAGSYGLGAALCLSGLFLYSQGNFSASFLAVLLAYPCLDMLAALVRRASQNRSLFRPDNDHLHNRIHFQLQKRFRSLTMANSLTGGSIVAASSGIALMGYQLEWLAVTSELWIFVFGCQCLVYGLAFYLTGLGRSVSRHVVDA